MLLTHAGTANDMFARIAETAWARQSAHQRFRFEERRPDDHPSRVPWVTANNVWQQQVRARKATRSKVS